VAKIKILTSFVKLIGTCILV